MNEIIEKHFMNPKNIGQMEDHDIRVYVGNPVCSDTLNMDLKIGSDGNIKDVRYHAYGCSTSLATASIVSEFLKKACLNDIKTVSRETIALMLGDLEPRERHCIDIGYSVVKQVSEKMKDVRKIK